MTIFQNNHKIEFGNVKHDNFRHGFFISAPDRNIDSFLTESENQVQIKCEEYKRKSKWPNSIFIRKVILADEKMEDSQRIRQTWFPV